MNCIYLALGSNIDKEDNLSRAVAQLGKRTNIRAISSAYETAPVGAPGADTYLNAAALVETPFAPETLKQDILTSIEQQLGRVRTKDKNAPRTIDIDIVLCNDEVRRINNRPIPDPEILACAHVAIPLAEIAPDYIHPQTGDTLAVIAARFAEAPGILHRPDIDLSQFL